MLTPRDYQLADVKKLRLVLRRVRAVIYQLPTGAGKTIVAGYIASLLADRGKRALVLVHRRELVRQFSKTLTQAGLGDQYGIIAAGRAETRWARFQIASVQSINRRETGWLKPDLVIVDEAHHVKAKTWENVLGRFPDTKVLGLTATPGRLDGKPLGDHFDTLVQGPSIGELVEQGDLAPMRVLRPEQGLSTAGVSTMAGDWNKKDLDERLTDQVIAAGAAAYRRYGAGKRAIFFAVNRHPVLPCSVQTELMSCALGNAPHEMLKDLVSWRMHDTSDPETMLLWLSATFAVDFESHRQDLEKTAAEHRDLIWSIRDRLDQKYQEIFSRSSIAQLVFIVEAFGSHWPCVGTPEGVTSGECNPWDASRFIERTLYSIASRPSSEATEALRGLINGPALTYADTAKHALALQRKVRRDSEYAAPSIEDLQAVMANGLPENIDEMRAYLLDHLDALQARMRGSDTDMWETYWKEENIPQPENFCRNRLVEHISGRLPASIRFGPETLMPRQKRADIAATRNAIGLPVEIKGQWHRDVWSAATDQLDTHYTLGWRAQGRGLYIVLWFGNLPKKNLPKHPDDLSRPDTPQELRQMLTDRIPEARRSQIDSFVMDVSRL